MTAPPFAEIVLWLGFGAAVGWVYLALLARGVAALAGEGFGRVAAAWLLLRVALAVAAFWLAARSGAAPLLLALGGFVLARAVAVRRIKARL